MNDIPPGKPDYMSDDAWRALCQQRGAPKLGGGGGGGGQGPGKRQQGQQQRQNAAAAAQPAFVELDDFVANMPMHNYIFLPTRQARPAASVNSRLPPMPDGVDHNGKLKFIPASAWLDKKRPVDQLLWWPGKPEIICDMVINEGAVIATPGKRVLNLYQPPTLDFSKGAPRRARRWVAHLRRVYPNDWRHIIYWFAHRVQRPHEKLNHALVLGGKQGIGKDTLIEPVKQAVGPWNCTEVSPKAAMGRFNGYLRAVICRISEVRDLGEYDRYSFYDHMKTAIAAPPDTHRIDEKRIQEFHIPNLVGVLYTSNRKHEGMHLDADDRRHYVAWSNYTKDDFKPAYWNRFWRWYENEGGIEHVAAYLMTLDISDFDPHAPPPLTDAFWEIVSSAASSEDDELNDVLEELGSPRAVTLTKVIEKAAEIEAQRLGIAPALALQQQASFACWLGDRKNAPRLPHRFNHCDYVKVENPNAESGRWLVNGSKVAVYARENLSKAEREAAAAEIQKSGTGIAQ